jgi:hypothetical protein
MAEMTQQQTPGSPPSGERRDEAAPPAHPAPPSLMKPLPAELRTQLEEAFRG